MVPSQRKLRELEFFGYRGSMRLAIRDSAHTQCSAGTSIRTKCFQRYCFLEEQNYRLRIRLSSKSSLNYGSSFLTKINSMQQSAHCSAWSDSSCSSLHFDNCIGPPQSPILRLWF